MCEFLCIFAWFCYALRHNLLCNINLENNHKSIMIKNLRRLLAFSVIAATMAVNAFAANPKREFRSSWMATVSNIDWPRSGKGTSASIIASQKSEMDAYLDKIEAMKMTSTCFQTRSMGDAMYPSQYAPWSYFLTGARGKDPGWDPLAYFVEGCHKRGIEAYVWLNPYRWSSSGIDKWNSAMDQEWVNKGMFVVGDDGTYVVFNPAYKETRELIVNVVKEILNNYNVDGILFDDYFYPSGGTTESSSADDYDDYIASGTTMSMGDWRRRNVNDMVADVYNAIKDVKPDVRFGISPAGVAGQDTYSEYGLESPRSYGVTASDWQYDKIYSEPLAWMKERTIDFISPQCYWLTTHSTAPFEPLTKWWSYAAKEYNIHYYCSHSVTYIASADNEASCIEMGNQIKYNRQYVENNACGSIFYSLKNVNGPGASSLGEYLKTDLFSTWSLTPEITWKSGPVYGKVANLAYSDGTLSWDETVNGNANIRYTVYAMPMSVTIDDAKAADGDGFDVKYLQRLVYGGSYTLDADKQNNYWYAVHVFDGYGKEHEAAIVNYPDGESEAAKLLSPVKGAVTAWVQDFSWSAVADATYSIEISDKADFTTMKYQESNIKATSVNVDLGDLDEMTVYYWRVRTAQPKKLEAVSEAESFKTPERPSAPKTTLLTPGNGDNFENNFTMTWSAVECDKYLLEVSASADFSAIKYNQTLTAPSHEMVISLLGVGTFYWRVTTMGRTVKDTVSDTRSFNITKIDVGNFEPGYSVMIDKDNESYEKKGDIVVNSIWHRSVDADYENIVFDIDGSLSRSFVAGDDYVYVTYRAENSSNSNIYLRKYSHQTGELMEELLLGNAGKIGYYPCNTVMRDSEGNICIANMTINASNNSIVVHLVDTETGELTQVADITPSINASARMDHVSIIGDVVAGNFKIYAGIRNSKYVVRWTYTDGKLSKEETCTLQSLYPSSASSLGTAPRVFPIDDDSFFLSGGETYLSRYTFASKGAMTDSFANNTDVQPIGKEANGAAFFTLNDTKYVVYPYADYSNGGFQFNVVKTDADMSFSSMELMWTLPKAGLGTVNSTTFQAEASYLPVNAGKGILYFFIPGNGLCAYEIIDTSVDGIDDVFADNKMSIVGNRLAFDAKADNVIVYNLMGATVASESNISSVVLNLPAGVYVIRASVEGEVIAKKVIIR